LGWKTLVSRRGLLEVHCSDDGKQDRAGGDRGIKDGECEAEWEMNDDGKNQLSRSVFREEKLIHL
jgi:hypothetical protein